MPLFSGFMYAAVGSYMVRVYRLFDLGFTRYPRRWLTAIVAAAIYANFFTHHCWWDLRWVLLVAVVVLWARTVMYARVWRQVIRMPLLAAFAGVAVFIYLAENIATWAGAWAYPDQLDGWQPVSITKLVSWFLLMIISVVLVAWVYPPRPPDAQPSPSGGRHRAARRSSAIDVARRARRPDARRWRADGGAARQAPATGAPPREPPRRRRRRRGAALPSWCSLPPPSCVPAPSAASFAPCSAGDLGRRGCGSAVAASTRRSVAAGATAAPACAARRGRRCRWARHPAS